jgi:2-oxoglutarate/2-oxoacid ferredoxin oxidoreductase subunit alpha
MIMTRDILSKEESNEVKGDKQYALAETGASPRVARAVPSWTKDPIYDDNDEHTEAGPITESDTARTAVLEKRLYRKKVSLAKDVLHPKTYQTDDAEVILLGFGSNYSVMKDAVDLLAHQKIGMIHLSQIWPFPSDELSQLLKNVKKIFTVENNAEGQLAGLLRQETGIKATDSILKYSGRPFNLDELLEKIDEVCKK